MISKLEVGQKYNIIGSGFWESFNVDLIVLGVSIYSQMETQDVDLYTDLFEKYGVEESVYEKLMKDNPYIYHCREITSRDPLLQKNDGTEYYIFPAMINYPGSSKLLDCVIHTYTTTLAPFQKSDDMYPYKKLNDSDISSEIKDTIQKMIYDGVTTISDVKDILVPEEEYNLLKKSRLLVKDKIESSSNQDASDIANERAYMYSVLENNANESERLSQLNISLKAQMKDAITKHNEAITLQETVYAKEVALRAKYTSIKNVIDVYNEDKPSGEQIILPSWDDL